MPRPARDDHSRRLSRSRRSLAPAGGTEERASTRDQLILVLSKAALEFLPLPHKRCGRHGGRDCAWEHSSEATPPKDRHSQDYRHQIHRSHHRARIRAGNKPNAPSPQWYRRRASARHRAPAAAHPDARSRDSGPPRNPETTASSGRSNRAQKPPEPTASARPSRAGPPHIASHARRSSTPAAVADRGSRAGMLSFRGGGPRR